MSPAPPGTVCAEPVVREHYRGCSRHRPVQYVQNQSCANTIMSVPGTARYSICRTSRARALSWVSPAPPGTVRAEPVVREHYHECPRHRPVQYVQNQSCASTIVGVPGTARYSMCRTSRARALSWVFPAPPGTVCAEPVVRERYHGCSRHCPVQYVQNQSCANTIMSVHYSGKPIGDTVIRQSSGK